MKTVGIVPARMAASRFPGKPLFPIHGTPMIQHVLKRASLYEGWDFLGLATCDKEIQSWAHENNWASIMTSDRHVRCLDRVAEAVTKIGVDIEEEDIIVCVQGDEPMLHPEMIRAVVDACNQKDVPCSVLGIDIVDDEVFFNKDTVKIIHDMDYNVLYTSRSPVPYCEKFTSNINAKRVGGIFAFKWHFLKLFTSLPESPLEVVESCDSNRICDNGYKQKVAPFGYVPYFSVDSPEDIEKVEENIVNDKYWRSYHE